MLSPNMMPSQVEQVADSSMSGDETLGLPH
jgi:hypothetical protein